MSTSIRIPVPTHPMPKPDRIITDLLDTETVYVFALWDGHESIGRPVMATGDGYMLVEDTVVGHVWLNDRLITSIRRYDRRYDDPMNR